MRTVNLESYLKTLKFAFENASLRITAPDERGFMVIHLGFADKATPRRYDYGETPVLTWLK